MGTVSSQRAPCPKDGLPRTVVAIHGYTGEESYGGRRLDTLGLPLWDVYVARAAAAEIALLTGTPPR